MHERLAVTVRQRTLQIRQFIIDHVQAHPTDIANVTAKRFKMTPQSARNHIQSLVSENVLKPEGKTRSRRYSLITLASLEKRYETADLSEDIPWSHDFKPLIENARQNVVDIVGIAFTEMLNNAIDHSESPTVVVSLTYTAATITVLIIDQGVGVFKKVKEAKNLIDERHAILELEKGRLTTSPDRHSGFGIFFTSRMVDIFSMASGDLFFTHFQPDSDWLIEVDRRQVQGTTVEFTIATNQERTAKQVYDQFCPVGGDGESGFSRTHVPLSLARYGSEQLVSRSQAKRVLARFNEFEEVLLDFKGVEMIGQGFADEIFRVFANNNPKIKIHAINTNSSVASLIRMVMKQRHDQQLRLF